jgi:hypothetical protein
MRTSSPRWRLSLPMGGTSCAAVKITGKDVKNGSLSGQDR